MHPLLSLLLFSLRCRDVLCKILERRGVPLLLLNPIKCTLVGARVVVKDGGVLSAESFDLTTGLKQGPVAYYG